MNAGFFASPTSSVSPGTLPVWGSWGEGGEILYYANGPSFGQQKSLGRMCLHRNRWMQ